MGTQKVNWTTQRKAIYELICSSEDHPTANELFERLHKAGHHFAYGTIYNSLRYLVDSGLITELKLGDTASRFDARVEDHLHLVCDSCGRISEAPLDLPGDFLSNLSNRTGFTIGGVQMVIRGICSDCQKSQSL